MMSYPTEDLAAAVSASEGAVAALQQVYQQGQQQQPPQATPPPVQMPALEVVKESKPSRPSPRWTHDDMVFFVQCWKAIHATPIYGEGADGQMVRIHQMFGQRDTTHKRSVEALRNRRASTKDAYRMVKEYERDTGRSFWDFTETQQRQIFAERKKQVITKDIFDMLDSFLELQPRSATTVTPAAYKATYDPAPLASPVRAFDMAAVAAAAAAESAAHHSPMGNPHSATPDTPIQAPPTLEESPADVQRALLATMRELLAVQKATLKHLQADSRARMDEHMMQRQLYGMLSGCMMQGFNAAPFGASQPQMPFMAGPPPPTRPNVQQPQPHQQQQPQHHHPQTVAPQMYMPHPAATMHPGIVPPPMQPPSTAASVPSVHHAQESTPTPHSHPNDQHQMRRAREMDGDDIMIPSKRARIDDTTAIDMGVDDDMADDSASGSEATTPAASVSNGQPTASAVSA